VADALWLLQAAVRIMASKLTHPQAYQTLDFGV
jgi:hypothetical protein